MLEHLLTILLSNTWCLHRVMITLAPYIATQLKHTTTKKNFFLNPTTTTPFFYSFFFTQNAWFYYYFDYKSSAWIMVTDLNLFCYLSSCFQSSINKAGSGLIFNTLIPQVQGRYNPLIKNTHYSNPVTRQSC